MARRVHQHAKAARDLGFSSRSAEEALTDAVRWFAKNGYFKTKTVLSFFCVKKTVKKTKLDYWAVIWGFAIAKKIFDDGLKNVLFNSDYFLGIYIYTHLVSLLRLTSPGSP